MRSCSALTPRARRVIGLAHDFIVSSADGLFHGNQPPKENISKPFHKVRLSAQADARVHGTGRDVQSAQKSAGSRCKGNASRNVLDVGKFLVWILTAMVIPRGTSPE
ncbi:MAG TPA: hypothetical protein VN872_01595, partial [Candidatus Acidoferrum sp.]|nr:hypothetical protein [Candidatus Acidoferrum sp.]